MSNFVIITNRKRAIIALIHSVVFLLIAVWSLATSRTSAALTLQGPNVRAALLLAGIYLAVTSILLLLFLVARRSNERLYFGFCASSAGAGLLRAILGDPAFHAGQYFRVFMLVCAVFTGTVILRTHGQGPVVD
jgi:uncharacterized membrane protein YwzB